VGDEVLTRLHEHVVAAGLDALICLSPENVTYAIGFVVPSHPLMRWRHTALVLTADGRAAVVCVDMERSTVEGAVADALPGSEVRVWREFGGEAMQTLAELLRDLDLGGGRIGTELSYLSVSDHAKLGRELPDATFVAADRLLERARQIKTPAEVERLASLSAIADRAIAGSFDAVTAGSTEMDLAAALTRGVYEQGAEQFKLMIVATGERSELPNVGPSERVLKRGDVCRVEIFPVIGGYHAGVCRTAVVGEPPPQAERVYQNLVECKHLVLDAIEPGMPTKEVYRVFRVKFDELGMPPISFVGHSIGVNLHERPYLGPDDRETLQPGMVLGIEPLVYRSGHGFGMQIKDMVAVTDAGCRLLSDVSDTDRLHRVEA
jgi:Xaa-Pro dipeptidase